MKIVTSGKLINEQALKMGGELKNLFNKAKRDQRGKLFISFAVIAAHLVNPETSISKGFAATGLDGPPPEFTPFFKDGKLLDDAKDALNVLATIDNTDPDSWGSFMEFSREKYA